MAYTTIDKPSDYFNTVTYVANQTDNRQITVGFQPDWTWLKDRDQAVNHDLYDSVRGATKYISSNKTNAEGTQTDGLKSFNSTGFTLGTGWGNQSTGDDYVSWNWKAGTSFTNDASATGIGSIDSTGSVNTDAGFSVISYTGTGSAGTVAHGLGSELACYIIKQRNTTGGWIVYHKGNTSSPQTDYLRLDKTDATVDDAIFNDTAPTSSVFSIGTNAPVNTSGGTYIAYCFNDVQGYSKFGSYTGNNNADGPFVFTGFLPAFIMMKSTSTGGDNAYSWSMFDNKRSSYNIERAMLKANLSDAEYTSGSNADVDILSNGFKMRASPNETNGANTYIYMAFAESPFVTSSGVPTTAR